MDKEHIENFTRIIQKLYGDEEIEVFYDFLSTSDWEENKMFEGKTSELMKLLNNEELNLTPSLIYSREGRWVVNTDYDLAFSTIDGKTELINELVENNPHEMYVVEY